MDNFSVFTPYNAGDLITFLPGLQQIWMQTGRRAVIYQQLDYPAFYYQGAEHPTKNAEGQQFCVNQKVFDALYPLLVAQPYIAEYVVWKGEKCDYDMTETRDRRRIPLPYGNIHHWASFVFPEMTCDLGQKWISLMGENLGPVNLSIKRRKVHKTLVINRTSRYQNPYLHFYFLQKYDYGQLAFIGLEDEYNEFCQKWELKNVAWLKTDNFLEVAVYLYYAKGFLGNQSVCWHIADAMKIPRVLEYSPHYPNTHPTGAGGCAAMYQEPLEYFVDKMLNS